MKNEKIIPQCAQDMHTWEFPNDICQFDKADWYVAMRMAYTTIPPIFNTTTAAGTALAINRYYIALYKVLDLIFPVLEGETLLDLTMIKDLLANRTRITVTRLQCSQVTVIDAIYEILNTLTLDTPIKRGLLQAGVSQEMISVFVDALAELPGILPFIAASLPDYAARVKIEKLVDRIINLESYIFEDTTNDSSVEQASSDTLYQFDTEMDPNLKESLEGLSAKPPLEPEPVDSKAETVTGNFTKFSEIFGTG